MMGLAEAEFVLKIIQWLVVPALVWCWRLDRRLTRAETQSADLEALHVLGLRVAELTGEIKALSARVGSLEATVKRQEDYLLHGATRND